MVRRAATADDLREIEALLTAAGLPLGGLARDYPGGYVITRDDTRLVGCAGVERYGEAGLLRSVAVSAAVRGQGIGAGLIADRRAWAAGRGLSALYLLTLDATEFFAGLGFRVVERSAVAVAVQASEEFTTTCPRSAVCMLLILSA